MTFRGPTPLDPTPSVSQVAIDVNSAVDPQDVLQLLNTDEEYEYRFVQERPDNITRRKLKGYEFVRPDEEKVRMVYDHGQGSSENLIRHGDCVLMRIKKNKKRAQQERGEKIGRLRRVNTDAEFKRKAREARVNDGEGVTVVSSFSQRSEPSGGDE